MKVKKSLIYQPVSKILLHLPPPRQKSNSLSLHKAKVKGSQTYFLLCNLLDLLLAFCFLFSIRVLSTLLTFASAGILCRFAIALAGSKIRLAFRYAAMIGSFGVSLFFSFLYFSHFLQKFALLICSSNWYLATPCIFFNPCMLPFALLYRVSNDGRNAVIMPKSEIFPPPIDAVCPERLA